jgi:hypothetical protein
VRRGQGEDGKGGGRDRGRREKGEEGTGGGGKRVRRG